MSKNRAFPCMLLCASCGTPNVPHMHFIFSEADRSRPLHEDTEIIAEIDEAVRTGKITAVDGQLLKQPIIDFENTPPDIIEQITGELSDEEIDRLATLLLAV